MFINTLQYNAQYTQCQNVLYVCSHTFFYSLHSETCFGVKLSTVLIFERVRVRTKENVTVLWLAIVGRGLIVVFAWLARWIGPWLMTSSEELNIHLSWSKRICQSINQSAILGKDRTGESAIRWQPQSGLLKTYSNRRQSVLHVTENIPIISVRNHPCIALHFLSARISPFGYVVDTKLSAM